MPTRMPDEMFMMMCHDRLRVETKKSQGICLTQNMYFCSQCFDVFVMRNEGSFG